MTLSPSRLDSKLLPMHRRLRSQPLLYRFTLGTRILLAAGFIPTGIVKLIGWRFTRMSPEFPIGAFFETLYLSGLYWRFLGLGQVIAGLCVLVPATATLGALLFLPIMLNVFVITLSYDFKFTPVITGLMLLANVYLLTWDYDRLRGIFGLTTQIDPLPQHRLGRFERWVYATGTTAGMGFFAGTRSLVPAGWSYWYLGIGLASVLAALWLGVQRQISAKLMKGRGQIAGV